MDFLEKIFSNEEVIKNLITLLGVLVLFGLTFLLGNRYNKGGATFNLWIARITAVAGCIVVFAWIFI